LARRGKLIEDRDENGERSDEDPDAGHAPIARPPAACRIECGSEKYREDEEDERTDKTRNQRPPGQADLPEGPHCGERERTDVGVESRDPPSDHEIARGEKHHADQSVVPTAPQRREVSAAAREDEADKCDQRPQQHGRPREVFRQL
jgi:hypothetical protein